MRSTGHADGVRRDARDVASPLLVGLTVLLVVALPFHWQFVWGPASINMSYGDVVVAVVGVLWLVGLLGPRRVPKYALPIAAFFGVAVLSLLVAAVVRPYYFSAPDGVVALVKFAGSVAWMVAAFAIARGRSNQLVPIAAGASLAVATAFGGWTVYTAVVGDVVRTEGPFNNPNIYGHYLVFNACLALYLREAWPDVARAPVDWLALLSVPVLAVAVVTTGSRGAILGLVGAAGTIVVLYSRRVDAARLTAAMAGLAAVLVAILAALAYVGVTFLAHLQTRLFKDIDSRLEMWSVAYDAFLTSPIVGIGYGQVPPLLSLHTGKEVVAHNVYVTIGAETGVVGLALFLGFLAWTVVDGWRLSTTAPAVIFLVAVVGGTAVQGVGTGVDNFRSFWTAVGLVAAHEADARHSDVALVDLLRWVGDRLRRSVGALGRVASRS